MFVPLPQKHLTLVFYCLMMEFFSGHVDPPGVISVVTFVGRRVHALFDFEGAGVEKIGFTVTRLHLSSGA